MRICQTLNVTSHCLIRSPPALGSRVSSRQPPNYSAASPSPHAAASFFAVPPLATPLRPAALPPYRGLTHVRTAPGCLPLAARPPGARAPTARRAPRPSSSGTHTEHRTHTHNATNGHDRAHSPRAQPTPPTIPRESSIEPVPQRADPVSRTSMLSIEYRELGSASRRALSLTSLLLRPACPGASPNHPRALPKAYRRQLLALGGHRVAHIAD